MHKFPRQERSPESTPCTFTGVLNTAAEAHLLIVTTTGLLLADTATEEADIDHLLDKPFDELTPSEWERLKQHATRVELMAA